MGREILHVSLGSEAGQVSAHYFNLLGLGVTNAREDAATVCNASTTHTTMPDHGSRLVVPRALFVDTVESHSSLNHDETSSGTLTPSHASDAKLAQPVWSGGVERLNLTHTNNHSATASPSHNPLYHDFQQAAVQLSQGAHSRYRRAPTVTSRGYSLTSSDGRAVDWDDLPDDEEEEQEDDEEERRCREQQDVSHWHNQVAPPLQETVNQYWQTMLVGGSDESHDKRKQVTTPLESTSSTTTTTSTTPPEEEASATETTSPLSSMSWREFWMPPYHAQSILNIPLSSQNHDRQQGPSWFYHPTATGSSNTLLREWISDDFLDGQVRRLLEDCDSCQGVVVATSGNGVHAGLATQLLHYLQDDCPSARRWIWSLEESLSSSSHKNRNDPSWRTQGIERVRHDLQVGLKWQDYLQEAHMVLTLQTPQTFGESAILAAALETATLSYRMTPSNNNHQKKSNLPSSRIGLNSYYYGSLSGESPFGTASSLSLSEYLSNLQPSPGLSVLELDAMIPQAKALAGSTARPLSSHLLEGTSLERDHRMREQPRQAGVHRPRDILPGSWMLNASSSPPSNQGLLTSLSPDRVGDRSKHTHFALSGALRYENHQPWKTDHRAPPSSSSSSSSDKYVDCLLQGMGIRYRPESSLAVHLDQGLSTLTRSGGPAGSYWKHVWKNLPAPDGPVLSVVGNTTRFYTQACHMGEGVKHVLKPMGSSKGYLNRDVINGILPEVDDCHNVLSSLYNVRDRYEPPRGSGLVDDEDEAFYE